MWHYQKPGFKGLLLTELQRQQQCSRFCDTMLKTEDISVPAHSCVLSAISPHISSALSTTPPPPPGQSRLLEFQALGACTLLRVVRLMYSGEMVGEGEVEKQEAISAAAKLGIHGLVEVTVKKGETNQGVGVGVQTEPLLDQGGRWVREVRDGSTTLWKERLADGVKDTWTQTEQMQVNAPAPETLYETIDLTCLENIRHTDSSTIPPQIPLIPISILYPSNENQIAQPSFGPMDPLQESTAAGTLSVVVDLPPSFSSILGGEVANVASPQGGWGAPRVAAGSELDDAGVEQYQGDITITPNNSGYNNNSLTTEKRRPQRGRPRGSRKNGGARGARRPGAGERKVGRPPTRPGGRGRGGFTETVAIQDVGVSVVQRSFLERWSMRSTRTGQGGGAVGRKLCLKARAILSKNKRRGRGKKELSLHEGGAGAGCNNTQDEPPLLRSKAATPGSFLSPPSRGDSLSMALPSTPSLQPSPSPSLWSPAGSYASPAVTSVPSTPQDEQVEQIDRLLEEVMMGLDIFPNSETQPGGGGGGGGGGGTYPTTAARENGRAVRKGGDPPVGAERTEPVPQQQRETEFREMLENFLSTFEKEVNGCNGTEDVETPGQSQTGSQAGGPQTGKQHAAGTRTPAQSQPPKAPAPHGAHPTRSSSRKRAVPNNQQKGEGQSERSPSRPKPDLKDLARSQELTVRKRQERENRQLQQIPVVKLERRATLPDRVILDRSGFQNLNSKSGKTEGRPSAGKCGSDRKSPTACADKKMYPIRSKLKDAHVDRVCLLEQPLDQHRRRKGRPKNGNVLDPSEKARPAEPLQKTGASARPRDEAYEAARKATRRKADAEERKSEDAAVSKRPRLEQTSRTPEYPDGGGGEAEEVVDVESFSPSSVGLLRDDKPVLSEINPGVTEGSSDSEDPEVGIIDVVGDEEDGGVSASVTRPTTRPGNEEEEVDVVGGNALKLTPPAAAGATVT